MKTYLRKSMTNQNKHIATNMDIMKIFGFLEKELR